jgi:Subtilisin inhibitor-like
MQAAVLAALVITVTPGNGAASHTHTLRCGPPGGTVSKPAVTCAKLAKVAAPFAPVPADTMCSQIYGGPQVARVHGTYRGKKVKAVFNRKNGCEIARWKRVSFLFT